MTASIQQRIGFQLKRVKFLNRNFGYLFELGTYLSYPFRPRRKPLTKFVIFGSGRSGSTLLVSLLNSNSKVFCDNEIFHRPVLFPNRYLKVRTHLGNKPAYGFKCLTYHLGGPLGLKREDRKAYLQYLHDQGYRILYLRRHNPVRQALSNLYARHRNQFHSNATLGVSTQEPMQVDLNELYDWVSGLQRQAAFEATLLEGIPHLPLSYEADLMDSQSHPATLKKLSEYLNLEFEAPDTELRKVTPKRLESFIANADEVRQFLEKKGYAPFLEVSI